MLYVELYNERTEEAAESENFSDERWFDAILWMKERAPKMGENDSLRLNKF